jgi:uncharacterized protein YciI
MPFYRVVGFDTQPHRSERREAIRPEHRAYVLANLGGIRLAGAMLDDMRDQCGSFYLLEAESEDAVRDWLRREPFVEAGVYETLAVREVDIPAPWAVPPRVENDR